MNTTNVPVTVCKGGGKQACARFGGHGPGGDGAFADLLLHASEVGSRGPEGAWSERAIQDARRRELDRGVWGASLSEGQGVDLGHMSPDGGLLALDLIPWNRPPMDVLAAVPSGPRILMPATGETSEEMKCAGTWAPEFPLSRDQCHKAISPPPQRDESVKGAPVLELLWELPAGPETRGPRHGDGQTGNPHMAALEPSIEDQPMRRSVEGGDESVVCLDMEKGLSERWGLRGWDGDVRGMRGQAGLGNEHMGPISLPGQGGESQEAQYTPTFLGTVRDAGQLRHDEAIDIRSPPAPSLGRGAFGTSAGGSHGHLVNLIVDPPNLGPFRVKIQVRGGDLRALFLADGAVQKAALETGLWDLRQRLVHQGLSVQELAVQVGAHGGDGWQGYLSREGTWVSQDASSGVGPAPERQGPCTGAVTVNRAQDGGTLDLLI